MPGNRDAKPKAQGRVIAAMLRVGTEQRGPHIVSQVRSEIQPMGLAIAKR